jgi:hypothetical protein
MPTLKFDKNSEFHQFLKDRLQSRYNLGRRGQQKYHDRWITAENTTLAYMHETEADNMRRNQRGLGTPKYTTIMIPYTYGMLMSAHTYWTSVFFARSPIHQFQGRHGEAEMQVMALEALVAYQVETGGMVPPYYIWLYDAGKYGHGILGNYWCKETLHFGQLAEMPDPLTGEVRLYQATNEVPGYNGTRGFNVSPWDFFPDPRVSLKHFQRGEFCIRRFEMGWNEIIKRVKEGYYNDNIKHLRGGVNSRKFREANSQLELPEFNLTTTQGLENEAKHATGASLLEVYIELIPNEWRLGDTAYPQKWCFTITEDLGTIIGASPLGYAHCQFPFDILECEVEGYGMYTRGIPEIMSGVQDTVDWLINTHFFNVRAALNNQFIVDPSKLVIKDVQNSGPGFVWRLRPEAYGTDLNKMFMQVPVQDVTRSNINDFQTMLGIGERTLGVNDQIMGALSTGSGRKTATEVRTTTSFGINRMKTICEYMSAGGFGSHAQKLVQNSQQFYSAAQKLRRVGSLAMDAGEAFLMVSPEDIAGFYDFVPVDGTLPIDRMAQANLWKEILAGVTRMPPQIQMAYDWSRIFAWAAVIGGLKNITQFRVQMMPDQALAAQAAAGNVIPMQPRIPGQAQAPAASRPNPAVGQPSASTEAGLNALGGGSGGGY